MGIFENLLHRYLEGMSNAVGQIEGRIMLFRLQRVDRLPGYANAFAKFFLRPVPLRTEHFEAVLHQFEVRMKGETAPNAIQNSG